MDILNGNLSLLGLVCMQDIFCNHNHTRLDLSKDQSGQFLQVWRVARLSFHCLVSRPTLDAHEGQITNAGLESEVENDRPGGRDVILSWKTRHTCQLSGCCCSSSSILAVLRARCYINIIKRRTTHSSCPLDRAGERRKLHVLTAIALCLSLHRHITTPPPNSRTPLSH